MHLPAQAQQRLMHLHTCLHVGTTARPPCSESPAIHAALISLLYPESSLANWHLRWDATAICYAI